MVFESCQKVAHHAMQVMVGIGYTNVYHIERIVRDLRLATIWTGSNEVMFMIIANECTGNTYKRKGIRLSGTMKMMPLMPMRRVRKFLNSVTIFTAVCIEAGLIGNLQMNLDSKILQTELIAGIVNVFLKPMPESWA